MHHGWASNHNPDNLWTKCRTYHRNARPVQLVWPGKLGLPCQPSLTWQMVVQKIRLKTIKVSIQFAKTRWPYPPVTKNSTRLLQVNVLLRDKNRSDIRCTFAVTWVVSTSCIRTWYTYFADGAYGLQEQPIATADSAEYLETVHAHWFLLIIDSYYNQKIVPIVWLNFEITKLFVVMRSLCTPIVRYDGLLQHASVAIVWLS